MLHVAVPASKSQNWYLIGAVPPVDVAVQVIGVPAATGKVTFADRVVKARVEVTWKFMLCIVASGPADPALRTHTSTRYRPAAGVEV